MIKKLPLRFTGFALLTATFSFSVSAENDAASVHAEKGASNPGTAALEEVVVSARRRDEMLQDTPIPVSAYTSEKIEQLGIHSIVDLQQNAPSLTITQNNSKNPSIFIRGMGQRTDVSLFDPSVGVYLNNILIPRHDSALLDTIDIENVQVLRGPQGTLFGKNNIGGAVLFTAKKPDLEQASGTVSTRIGDYGRQDYRLTGNLPLIEDKLGLRVTVNSTKLDGYFKNEVDGKDFGDENRRSGALSLLWNASDSFNAEFFGYFSHIRERGLPTTCIFQNQNATLPKLTFPGQPSFVTACNASEAASHRGDVTINSEFSHYELDNNITALTLNWNINDDLSLSNIISFTWSPHVDRSDDGDGTAAQIVSFGAEPVKSYYQANGFGSPAEHRKQLTEELKLSGTAFNENLHFTGGLFGSSEKISQSANGSVVGPAGIAGVSQSLLPASITLPPDTIIPLASWSGVTSDLQNTSYAAFGELSFNPTELIELTLGGRYTSELRHRDIQASQIDYSALSARLGVANGYLGQSYLFSPIPISEFDSLPNTPLPLTDFQSQSASKRFNKFTPSATVSLSAPGDLLKTLHLDSMMSYFTYSRGFKAGGFDVKESNIITVNPETVTNYEFGIKTDALDHHLRVNGSFFITKWKDMQLQVAEQGPGGPTDIQIYFSNAGAATIEGVELETVLAAGNWNFQLSGSYLDSGYDKFTTNVAGVGVVDRSGEPLYSVPQYSYTASVEYNLKTSVGVVVPRLSYYFRDKAFMGYDYQAAKYDSSWSDDIKLLNFRLTYFPTDHLRTALYVDNLTNENYISGGFSVAGSLGAASVTQGTPRTYGVELSYSF